MIYSFPVDLNFPGQYLHKSCCTLVLFFNSNFLIAMSLSSAIAFEHVLKMWLDGQQSSNLGGPDMLLGAQERIFRPRDEIKSSGIVQILEPCIGARVFETSGQTG